LCGTDIGCVMPWWPFKAAKVEVPKKCEIPPTKQFIIPCLVWLIILMGLKDNF